MENKTVEERIRFLHEECKSLCGNDDLTNGEVSRLAAIFMRGMLGCYVHVEVGLGPETGKKYREAVVDEWKVKTERIAKALR